MASRAASSCGSLQQFSRKKRELQLLRVQQFLLKSCKGSRLCPGRDHRLVKRDLSELPFTSIRIWGFGPRFRYHPSIHPNLQLRTNLSRKLLDKEYHLSTIKTLAVHLQKLTEIVNIPFHYQFLSHLSVDRSF